MHSCKFHLTGKVIAIKNLEKKKNNCPLFFSWCLKVLLPVYLKPYPKSQQMAFHHPQMSNSLQQSKTISRDFSQFISKTQEVVFSVRAGRQLHLPSTKHQIGGAHKKNFETVGRYSKQSLISCSRPPSGLLHLKKVSFFL